MLTASFGFLIKILMIKMLMQQSKNQWVKLFLLQEMVYNASLMKPAKSLPLFLHCTIDAFVFSEQKPETGSCFYSEREKSAD